MDIDYKMGEDIKMKELWQNYLNKLSSRDRDKILYAAIEHLLEMEEIRFQVDDIVDRYRNPIPEEASIDEFLYWTASGEDLLDS